MDDTLPLIVLCDITITRESADLALANLIYDGETWGTTWPTLGGALSWFESAYKAEGKAYHILSFNLERIGLDGVSDLIMYATPGSHILTYDQEKDCATLVVNVRQGVVQHIVGGDISRHIALWHTREA